MGNQTTCSRENAWSKSTDRRINDRQAINERQEMRDMFLGRKYRKCNNKNLAPLQPFPFCISKITTIIFYINNKFQRKKS